MKILIITNLFPNSKEPARGVFNLQQFKALSEQGVEIKVVAPIPWHHFSSLLLKEAIDGFDVYHPRYFITPKIGRALYGLLFFISIFKTVKRLCDEFKPDALLATWAYPDAVGSFLCAKILKKPLLVKVHGSDINLYAKHWLRRAQISYVLSRSNKVIAVSGALKQQLVKIGVPVEKIAVIPNGIDTELFKPLDQVECRKKLGLPLDKKIILYVGNFAQVKGVDILVDAFGELVRLRKDILLVLVGDGPLDKMLREKVKMLGFDQNVLFTGRTSHDSICYYMNTCDIFCLPSRDEGCPNVVLEAMACGKPVVATNVGGIPELITLRDCGILVSPEDTSALTSAFYQALNAKWDTGKIVEFVKKSSWAENAKNLYEKIMTVTQNYADIPESSKKKSIKLVLSCIIPKSIIFWQNKKKVKKAALTFDDGPNIKFTGKILDILKERNIKATFFLVGKEIRTNKELAERVVKEGHNIGAHSYNHKDFQKLNVRERLAEAVLSLKIIKDELGVNTDFFRPPQGEISFSQVNQCYRNKIRTVLWSFDTCDYKYKTPLQITRRLEAHKLKNGEIILLHDDNACTLEALPKIIDFIKRNGFELITLSELLS